MGTLVFVGTAVQMAGTGWYLRQQWILTMVVSRSLVAGVTTVEDGEAWRRWTRCNVVTMPHEQMRGVRIGSAYWGFCTR